MGSIYTFVTDHTLLIFNKVWEFIETRQATADSKWCRNSRVLYVFTLLNLSPSRLLPGMFEKLTLLIALYSTRIVELRTSFNYIKSYAAAEGLNHTTVVKKQLFFNTAWSKYIKATYVYISLLCLFFIFTNVRSKVIYLQQNLVIWRSLQLTGLCNKNKKSFEMTWTQTNCAPTDKSDR